MCVFIYKMAGEKKGEQIYMINGNLIGEHWLYQNMLEIFGYLFFPLRKYAICPRTECPMEPFQSLWQVDKEKSEDKICIRLHIVSKYSR